MTVSRLDLNQWLVDTLDFESYLEIGVQQGWSFEPLKCPTKVGVDPAGGATHTMTSDEFFAENREKFDLVFIDGCHHHDFVFRDIQNSLKCLTKRGIITLHDCWPPDEDHESQGLCGTAWRALAHYRQDPKLDTAVGAFDFGIGVILQRSNTSPILLPMPYGELAYKEKTPDTMRLMKLEALKTWILAR